MPYKFSCKRKTILFSFFFFFSFYCYSITVVCLFSPSLHPTPAEPTSLPHLHPPPWFCPCVLYSSSCWNIRFKKLVIFCLLFSLVDYVPVKGEIIWYLSLKAWLISLSIMLSSSIHAVTKSRSSLLLCSIPLCKCSSFLIHSINDEHLGCFQH